MPLRDLIPDPEFAPDISDSRRPAPEEVHREEWGADEQSLAQQHYSMPRPKQHAER